MNGLPGGPIIPGIPARMGDGGFREAQKLRSCQQFFCQKELLGHCGVTQTTWVIFFNEVTDNSLFSQEGDVPGPARVPDCLLIRLFF